MPRTAPRRLRDTAWAAVGVAGAFGGIRAMEMFRPKVIADDSAAPENRAGQGEMTRAYFFSAGAIIVSPPLATSVRLPKVSAPLGLAIQAGSVGLRVWAMHTLRGHYAPTLRVVDDQPVVRSGPYRFVRHPGYLSVLLLWAGAALTARNAASLALTLTAVGTAYQHRMDAEDALLLRDLPGYVEYAETTRRMAPWPRRAHASARQYQA
jgi:protein-S-isoprenylcysteine O-methyltransferase Ste14